MKTQMVAIDAREFSEFFLVADPRLRGALVAAYGSERGREAAAEALAYAWQHWDTVGKMANPIPYLYRVGQSHTRPRQTRWFHATPEWSEPWVEPELSRALGKLTERQRLAVVLIVGFDWSLADVAELTGIAVTTLQNHLERGMTRLRAVLEVVSNEAR